MSWLSRVVAVLCVSSSALAADGGLLDGGSADAGDAGGDGGACEAGSGLSCEQCDVSGYTVSNQNPPIVDGGACTATDITNFVTDCADTTTATAALCSSWQTSATAGCATCVLTKTTDAKWGPIVCPPTGACSYNVPGCIDLQIGQVSMEKGNGGTGSCGDLFNASYGCQDYACGTCSTTTTDFQNCATSAVSNECSSYANAAASTLGPCGAVDGSASETACFLQGGDSDINALVTLMCGGYVPPVPDAGTSDSGTPTDGGVDSGIKKDAGTTKDSGSPGADSGGDAGSEFGQSGGCHCDAAGIGSTQSTLATMGLAALVMLALGRRRRRS